MNHETLRTGPVPAPAGNLAVQEPEAAQFTVQGWIFLAPQRPGRARQHVDAHALPLQHQIAGVRDDRACARKIGARLSSARARLIPDVSLARSVFGLESFPPRPAFAPAIASGDRRSASSACRHWLSASSKRFCERYKSPSNCKLGTRM